jgi:phage tail sheath gpL-like
MAVIPAFDEIPLDWRVPGADLEIRPTYTEAGLFDYPARGLIIAPMLSTGTAEAGRLYRVTRPSDGIALCGAGSIGAAMIEAARTANRSSDLWMVAIPDAAGATAATGKISFGNALGAGALAVYIGGRRVRIVLTTSMTAPQRAAALVAAINADTAMPVAAAQGTDAATHEVLLTARHGGETGNDILIRLGLQADEVLPAGAQVTVTAMSGGAGDPDVQDAIDAINEQKFDAIALPWTGDANLTVLAEELRQRYTAMARLDGHGYAASRGTFGQLTTKGTVTNSPHLTLIGADASPTPPWIWAATLMAVSIFHLTQDPARQLRTLQLPGVIAPDPASLFSETEQDLLLRSGISTFTAGTDRSVYLSRVITTYRQTALGTADSAWLDINVPVTLSRIRYDWRATMQLTYPRHKLAEDGSIAEAHSKVVATPRKVRGTWAARCNVYGRAGWIRDVKRTLESAVFQIDPNEKNQMLADMPVNIIGNLIRFNGVLEFEA